MKTVDFSETSEACDLKVGRYRQLIDFMNVTRWTKQAFSCSKFLSPGGQLWANTAFEGSQFYSIGVPKFYSWVNVISFYAYNDLG